jgi:signal transduction histidine kinase/CheY-like chemotaxis protein
MKLTNMKIGTQLRLGMGAILFLVVALGVRAWLQTDKLWFSTKDLYEHPLQVRRAIGHLEADIESMARHVRDLFLAQNDQEKTASLQNLEIRKTDAGRQFNILYDRYLGPRDDITTLQDDFLKWNVLRDETIRLLQAGKTAEAAAGIRPGGGQAAQGDAVRSRLQKIDDFAKNKGDEFYAAATAQNDTITRQLAVFVIVILLLALVVAWLLLKGIKDPLAELTAATDAFRQGKLDGRCGYTSANEFGALAASFNTMAATIQTEMQVNKNAAQLAGVMLREEEVHAFCREMLKELLHHTDSQVGAVYFLNEAKTDFEHFASIGLGAGGRAAFSATALEGELGTALATRKIQRITDIPADTRFAFAAVSGEFQPREILTIPVLSDHSVAAVISLASVRAYDAASVRLVNDIWSVLTARVNGVLAFRKSQDLAATLERQNRELEAQKRELVSQATEVAEQNTELEMQKRQLDEANRLKSAFLSNMSHELRTPLNSVIALSGVLSRRLATTIPAEERGYLEIIERNGKGLLTLINDILDLSRIEAGREELGVSRCSVRDLAGELVAMLEPQAVEKKIALLNQVPADLPLIATDPDKLRHILQNLIGNAVKFTEQGQVVVRAEVSSDRLSVNSHPSAVGKDAEFRISVTDTGIGIAADHLPHIFDEFRQADGSTSRKYGGTGLGLAIAKKYAQLLGGGITVASTPGQGSTFTLRLPLALEGERPALSEVEGSREPGIREGGRSLHPQPPAGQGQTILVVEDNESAIIQLTDILQSQGYRVLVAHNGQEALAQIAQNLPAAMILDLMMPEVDGFAVLKAIRGLERSARLPVLILTAKHVTREELSFLKGNHIHQLLQKGDINKAGLLAEVARMVAPPQVQPAPQPARRRRSARPGKPIVLVVEDNPDNLRTARALLADRYQVVEAEDGKTGVELARTHRPDIILTDISLPVMDGIAVLAAIREDEALRATPVIAVTASAMKGDRETILAHGFDGYLSKPIDHDALMKTLQQMLD